MGLVTSGATLSALALGPRTPGSLRMSGAALLFQRTGVAGNLVQPARMTLARALSPTRIRIDFDKPLDDNSVLRDPASYRIESASFGLVPFVASVRVPDVTAPRFVELATSEMTNLAPYTVRVEPFTVESSGVPVAPDALSFAGLGVGPELVVAVGVSPTRVDVRFTEPLKAMPVTRDPAGYTFSGGLVVESVLAIDEDTIALQTSEQTPGELYTLTVTAVVADHAKNPMWAANVTDVLGYTPDTQDARESIRIYDFLIEAIRTEDQKAGAFLERFLEGPQKIWEATLRTALDLPKLWSAEEMPDEALALQKHIVGWTDRLRAITDRLDPLALRRLIASSVKFWQQRGPEDSIIDALRMTTGARGRILNWFDYRWILGETHLGVENDGLDPWLLSSPFDGGDDDTQVYNVRIVDDGDLDRELVRAVVSLTRPLGEQAEVTYLALLDLFETDGDDSQWQQITGTSAVLAGRYSFGPASTATVAVDGAELWSEYVVRARMRGTGAFGLAVYVSGPQDYYVAGIDLFTGYFVIYKLTGGVRQVLTLRTISGAYGDDLHPDVFYGVQVEVVNSGTETKIRLFIDGEKVAEAIDGDHVNGGIGFGCESGSSLEVDSVEVFFVPAPTDFVGLGS